MSGLNAHVTPMAWIHRMSTLLEQEYIARRNRAAAMQAEARRRALLYNNRR